MLSTRSELILRVFEIPPGQRQASILLPNPTPKGKDTF